MLCSGLICQQGRVIGHCIGFDSYLAFIWRMLAWFQAGEAMGQGMWQRPIAGLKGRSSFHQQQVHQLPALLGGKQVAGSPTNY